MQFQHSFLPDEFDNADCSSSISKGGNQSGIKIYNQNLIISLIRQHKELTKADIARLTNLSNQTVSVNINLMLQEQIIVKKELRRGSVGQPSMPVKLNPKYAYSIGIKIGRSSLNVLLMSFDGTIEEDHVYNYDYPNRQEVLQKLDNFLPSYLANPTIASKIQGISVAIPDNLDGWRWELGITGQPQEWNNFNLKQYIHEKYKLPVKVINDASAACVAEFLLSQGKKNHNFVYIYLGTFIGGGLVLNGNLYLGSNGKAGAIASMPIQGTNEQFLHKASLNSMRHQMSKQKIPLSTLSNESSNKALDKLYHAWVESAAPYIAHTVASISAVLDIDTFIIDGIMNLTYKKIIIESVQKELQALNTEGITIPTVKEGKYGLQAPTIGAAIVPLYQTFVPNAGVVQKSK